MLLWIISFLKKYENYIEHYDHLLTELEYVLKRNRRFDLVYKEFESQKFCYLSLISFLFKPLQRLLHYSYLLESNTREFSLPFHCSFSFSLELLIYYKQNNNESDYQDCYGIYIKIQDHIENINESLASLV